MAMHVVLAKVAVDVNREEFANIIEEYSIPSNCHTAARMRQATKMVRTGLQLGDLIIYQTVFANLRAPSNFQGMRMYVCADGYCIEHGDKDALWQLTVGWYRQSR